MTGPITRVQRVIPVLDVHNTAEWLDVRDLELTKFEVGIDIQCVDRCPWISGDVRGSRDAGGQSGNIVDS
jgi:hypothetical protein